ncbi:centrosome-associated protein 350-like [Littorina saxatilis]|uniref:centrosome-associated protein 350-like n=1 Tax=Littorina saxatilis TaxID=31220 RepID=UPI0038B63455
MKDIIHSMYDLASKSCRGIINQYYCLSMHVCFQPCDEDDSVTETSTFSEVTVADDWAAQTPKRKPEAGRNGTTPAPETGAFSGVQYRAPAPGPTLRWENPHSDPYSVLNVFSRNQRYVKAPGRPDRQSARDRDTHPQSNSTQLKDPKMTSSQQVVFGQTLEGHPMMTRTTYTRVEATLQDRSQASQPSASGRTRATRSEDRSERLHQHSFPSRHRSTSDDTLESDDDVTPKAVSSRQTTKKSAIGFRRQVSDTGQETDVSQLSEDEPRVSLRNYDHPIVVDTTQDEPAEARWSPAALERQMAAELARLESLEDSIRQLSSAERTRAVALAQQETVSVAQVLKARQQEHSAELRTLQLQVQEERLASAQQLQQQLNMSKGVQAPASDMSLLSSIQANRQPGNRTLLVPAENRRPDTKATSPSPRSGGRDDTEYSETFTKSASSASPSRSAVTRSPTTRSKTSSVKTAEDSVTSIVKTAEDSIESVKTAEDSDASIKTASDADRHSPDVSAVPEEVPDGDYSLSFDESMTEDESFRQAAGNRRDTQRQKSSRALTEDGTSYRVNDLTSVFGGEDSFNRFTIDIVRNIMREEEMRAQHQESLLRIRVKALKEKTKTQLSLLEQERQRLKGKEKDQGVQRDLKRLTDKEKAVRKEQEEHQAEINRMFKTEELAREHRQSLLKQHEQIAKMQNETREKMKQLQGRLGRPADVHTEDETSMVSCQSFGVNAVKQKCLMNGI